MTEWSPWERAAQFYEPDEDVDALAVGVELEDGPAAGERGGLLGRVVGLYRPPYFCTPLDGVWHHYADVPGSKPPKYVYAGLCDAAGHDEYESDDAPEPPP